jgi:asparagine synthase (glutamine-hydrolysing)
MCGIAGIVSLAEKPFLTELQKMGDTLAHRGPDDEGFFVSDHVGFVHKRLSIIDLITGQQPMSSKDGMVTIVFNGEIYNYLELRLDLINKGHYFVTSSDTEVLLHLYEEYGTEFLPMLNGMFAFVIYDQKCDRVFAARDQFGIKPFYYVFEGSEFVFASEPKAILSIRPSYCHADEKALYDYITFQFCLHEKTFFRGIKKLLPGHYLILDHVSLLPSLHIGQYWNIEFSIDTEHTEEYFVDKLMMLLQDSVRLQLRSDVPMGLHLSGGLDSSTITCLTSRLLGTQVKTFTGAFDDGLEYDETEFAREVSRFAQTEYFEIRPTAQDFAEKISEIIYHMDEPSAGPGVFPQYFVSKLAAQHVKVVLGGQGGDELFGGYARYLVAYLEQCLKGAILETNEEGKFVVTLDSIIPNLPVLREYTPLLQSFLKSGLFEDMDRRYFQLINRSPNSAQYYSEDLLSVGRGYNGFESFCEIFNAPDTKSYINKMTYFDMKTLLPALLHVEDRTSMTFSLESRVPLLDYRIVELMATIPPNIKWKGGQSKYLFRRAIETLIPTKVMNRKDKKGFPVPLSKWMQGELKGFVHDILLSQRARERGVYNVQNLEQAVMSGGKYDRQLWGLLCMELWYQSFID